MERPKSCKLVTEHLDKHGYPYIQHDGKWTSLARVVLAEKLGRPIRDGYEACHHCDTPACVEPEHLYEGTHTRNMRDAGKRGRLKGWASLSKINDTHCAHGHAYTPENIYWERGYRRCKECRRMRYQRWKRGTA